MDVDRPTMNKLIAEAIGWRVTGVFVDNKGVSRQAGHPPGGGEFQSIPDFFTDPIAFMVLWEWLRQTKRWEIGIHVEGRDFVDVYVADLDCHRCGTIGSKLDDNIMVALAISVYAAIKKLEKK